MKILIITNLYPNSKQPQRGIFNRQQFRELSKFAELKIVAPLPWVPKGIMKKGYEIYRAIPQKEILDEMEIFHPRYTVIPKKGNVFSGRFYYWGIKDVVKSILKEFSFDAILTTWAYPDAYAASYIAKKHYKPLVTKVHGTDINVLTEYPAIKKRILKGFKRARTVVTVSAMLKEKLMNMGVDTRKIKTLMNGIDKDIFKQMNREECRRRISLNPEGKHVVFIGNLVPIKGVSYLIEAVKNLSSNVHLHILGGGPLESRLIRLAMQNNIADRVHFHGKHHHAEIPVWLNAADCFCLPSINEGCPNVVLEALACGTPVVGTNVGAIPELVDTNEKGVCVEPKQPRALAEAITELLNRERQSHDFTDGIMSWEENAHALYGIIKGIV